MRNTIYLLTILILCQSCYSYKTFNIKESESIPQKKVKIELNNSKKIKGTVIEIKGNKIILKKAKEVVEIPISSIKKIKKRKFSYLKTVGAATAAIIIISTIVFIVNIDVVFSNSDWNWNWI